MMPPMTSASPSAWYPAKRSPRIITASAAPNTGTRLMNWPARLPPINSTPRA